jgi:large subunit ribosomal protein L6
MSRIGKNPVKIVKGADVKVDGTTITVKGPKGTLTRTFSPLVDLTIEDGGIQVTRKDDTKPARAMHGTARAIIFNMVTGVTEGYKKELLIEGTGYRAEQVGKNLQLAMGFSHPVHFEPPEGVTFEVPKGNKSITISGPDKEVIGQIAAQIRLVRPPEPYKGKGIRYSTERIRRKAGKAGKAGGKKK